MAIAELTNILCDDELISFSLSGSPSCPFSVYCLLPQVQAHTQPGFSDCSGEARLKPRFDTLWVLMANMLVRKSPWLIPRVHSACSRGSRNKAMDQCFVSFAREFPLEGLPPTYKAYRHKGFLMIRVISAQSWPSAPGSNSCLKIGELSAVELGALVMYLPSACGMHQINIQHVVDQFLCRKQDLEHLCSNT